MKTVDFKSLNALSGIGGFQTLLGMQGVEDIVIVLMPCRALEAFRQEERERAAEYLVVLMPCRALEAFRRGKGTSLAQNRECLNALSGIGGFQTHFIHLLPARIFPSLNALSGIGGFQTMDSYERLEVHTVGLNALSGIGGFQTEGWPGSLRRLLEVLMPCRALEAFRLSAPRGKIGGRAKS